MSAKDIMCFSTAIIDQMRNKISPVKSTSLVNDDEDEEKKWRRYVLSFFFRHSIVLVLNFDLQIITSAG